MTPLEQRARDRLGPPPWTSEHLRAVVRDRPAGVTAIEWWVALDEVTRTDRATP